MKKQFCTYEISKELKELDFDEPCLACFEEHRNYQISYANSGIIELFGGYTAKLLYNPSNYPCILAPLWQQAWSFLFKKLDFYHPFLSMEIYSDYSGKLYHPKDVGIDELEIDFDNKEQLILKLIELIKNKQLCKKELNITK